jgi:hypothetical protein
MMKTTMLLMAQYDGRALIPLDLVCRDYFWHLTPDKFTRKVSLGEIRLPVVRMEKSQKAARGVHLADLAAYIDQQRAAAQRELEAMTWAPGAPQ